MLPPSLQVRAAARLFLGGRTVSVEAGRAVGSAGGSVSLW